MPHFLITFFLIYLLILVVTGFAALVTMLLFRFRSRNSCICPRCGRSERMKPYGNDPRIRTRIAYLLYLGIVPGIIYYIWISRFHLCPHCLNVSTSDQLDGRQVVRSGRKRRRRSRSQDDSVG